MQCAFVLDVAQQSSHCAAGLANMTQEFENEKRTRVSLQEELSKIQPQVKGAVQLKQFVHGLKKTDIHVNVANV